MPGRPRASATALKAFEEQFGKSFGQGVLKRPGRVEKYEVVPTGSIALDYALGVGGYVEGRMTEIWGPDGTGKTTLSLIAIANAQAKDPNRMCAFIDVENKLDLAWAVKLGVDLSRMYHVVPPTAEEVADIIKALLQSQLISFIVLDSIGSMVNTEEIEKDANERSVGTTPGIITRMVKIAASLLPPARAHLFIINQVRANLGYGADTTTGGGFALKHATVHRLKARKAMQGEVKIGSGDNAVQVGQKIAVKVEKNGVASPGRTAIITLINTPTEKYGEHIGIADIPGQAFDVGKKTGVLARKGAVYTLPDGTEVKSEEACRKLLGDRPDLVEAIRQQVIAIIASGDTGSPTVDAEEEPDERDPDVAEGPVVKPQDEVEVALAGMDV